MSRENAYRYLFPLGWLNALAGAGLWIAFRHGWILVYPVEQHAQLMIGGFLLSFALGFLWTAAPRFLQAPPPGGIELALITSCLALLPVLSLLHAAPFFYVTAGFAIALTLRFGFRRFRLRRTNPPTAFFFVAIGLVLALASLLVLGVSSFLHKEGFLYALARNLFLKGFPLFLVLGIGSRLVPALLGHGPMPNEILSLKDRSWLYHGLVVGCVIGALALESAGLVAFSGALLFFALMIGAMGPFRLAGLPLSRSAVAWSVWLASWFVSLAPLSFLIFPEYVTHVWHLFFISGIGLLTLGVSARVSLAHSGREFRDWEKHPSLYLSGGLVVLAALMRVTAPFLPGDRLLSHYEYAAWAWILALVLWGGVFLKFTSYSRQPVP